MSVMNYIITLVMNVLINVHVLCHFAYFRCTNPTMNL